MAPLTRSQTHRARPNALIKFLRAGRTHYDHTYTEGLNICRQPWNNGICTDGGLYACPLRDFFEWVTLYPDITEVAWVEVPENARREWFDTKIKASMLVLTGFMSVADAMHLAVRAGANIHFNNDKALRSASEHGNTDLVKLLLQAGADVHAYADGALRNATLYIRPETVRVLLQAGADVHVDNDKALHVASSNGYIECVRLLLQAGADVHALDDRALCVAAYFGHTECVRLLLQAGAARNDRALRLSSERGHSECTRLLKSFM